MTPANPYDLGSIAREDARRKADPNGWAVDALKDQLVSLERRVLALEKEHRLEADKQGGDGMTREDIDSAALEQWRKRFWRAENLWIMLYRIESKMPLYRLMMWAERRRDRIVRERMTG